MILKTLAVLVSLCTFGILEIYFPFFNYSDRLPQRILPNVGLGVCNFLITGGTIAGILRWIWHQSFWSGWLTIVTSTGVRILVSILILDLYLYTWHRLMHKTHWGWSLHQVHHTEISMQIFTSYRFHPLEVILSNLPKLSLIFLMGIEPEALIIYETCFAISLIFHHSNIALPYDLDRGLSLWIVTPNYHRRHHSKKPGEMDSNYGSLLSVWDHFFGTYRYPKVPKTIELGLGTGGAIVNPLYLCLQPFLRL